MVKENKDTPQVQIYKIGPKKGRMKTVKQRGVELSVPDLDYTQAHHIIHFILQEHDVWGLAGINVNCKSNIILLPTKIGALLFETTRSIHDGKHDEKVTLELKKKMNDLIEKGAMKNFTQQQYKKKLEEIIDNERNLLKSGERILNKNTRESVFEPENKARILEDYARKERKKELKREKKIKDEERRKKIANDGYEYKLRNKIASHRSSRLSSLANKNKPKSRAKANNKNAERKEKQEKKSKIKFSPVKINKNIPGKTPKSVK
ncbi:MAG: hypothetical protein COB50_05145, partial [Thiotrichales bacterium]